MQCSFFAVSCISKFSPNLKHLNAKRDVLCFQCWKIKLTSSISKQLSLACQYEHQPKKNSLNIICLPPFSVFHSSVCPLGPPSSFSIDTKPRPSEIMIMQPFFISLSAFISPTLPPSAACVLASPLLSLWSQAGVAQGSMNRSEPSFNCRLSVMEIISHSRNNG